MERSEIEQINRERLEGWRRKLVESHATPILLVGVGHDEKKGLCVLCTTEEMTNEETTNFLLGAYNMLKRGMKQT